MNTQLTPLARAAIFGFVPLAILVSGASAQEEDGTCTAELSPASIRVESPAIRVTARLSADIGEITAVDGPDESGVRLSSTAELELMARTADTDDTDTEEPVALSGDRQTATLWLNTEDATPGRYTIALEGETGVCTSDITIDGLEA